MSSLSPLSMQEPTYLALSVTGLLTILQRLLEINIDIVKNWTFKY
jgi:hypothetical protein